MNIKPLTGILLAALVLGGTAVTIVAQSVSGPGRHGNGNGNGCSAVQKGGGDCAAKQADCIQKNGGVCSKGGAQASCAGYGQGNGKCLRQGLRDGTGPRAAKGACVNAPATSANQK